MTDRLLVPVSYYIWLLFTHNWQALLWLPLVVNLFSISCIFQLWLITLWQCCAHPFSNHHQQLYSEPSNVTGADSTCSVFTVITLHHFPYNAACLITSVHMHECVYTHMHTHAINKKAYFTHNAI